MWIEVSKLASYIGKTPRTVQLKIKSGAIAARKKDNKSFEVDVLSLPEKWKEKLPAECFSDAPVMTALVKPGSAPISPSLMTAIGRPLTDKERQIFDVWQYVRSLDPMLTDNQRIHMAAVYFGISDSTVKRHIRKVEENGVIGNSVIKRKSAWSPEAETFLKSYYLQLIKDRNINSKMAAWKALQKMAAEQGWDIGCQAGAYAILKQIPKLYLDYAIGGNRALDNIFYIKRDWSNLKPAQIFIGDQHICDFWVKEVKDGKERYYRPTFYVWEDAASRCIAGLSVDENYNSDTVNEALYMAITRFGFFDCTYNDNGTSECSKATTTIIDELIALSGGRTRMMDISELYRMKDGSYSVEDENGQIIDIAPDINVWRKKHRRIYANVKNAKTKPIERLFSTLEMKMAQMGIPGHVVTPGCPADQEEKESKELERQKRNGEILTLDEFVYKFIEVINDYENTRHSELGCTPIEFVNRQIAEGWTAKLPANLADLDFIFMSRKMVKVTKGRVTIGGLDFIVKDLETDARGNLLDKGLHMHNGEKVEVRYSKADLTRAYAVLPEADEPVRALHRVESITMLDEEAMQERIEWKRHNMKLVREAFKLTAYPTSIRFETKIAKQVEDATKPIAEIEDKEAEERYRQLMEDREEKKTKPSKHLRFFSSERERFKWCLNELIEGNELSRKDADFMQSYRNGEEYQEEKEYWTTYERFGGL